MEEKLTTKSSGPSRSLTVVAPRPRRQSKVVRRGVLTLNEEPTALTFEAAEPSPSNPLRDEMLRYIKGVKSNKKGRVGRLKVLRKKVKGLTEERIFREVYSLESIQDAFCVALSKDNSMIVAILKNLSLGVFLRDQKTGLYYLDHLVKGSIDKVYRLVLSQKEDMIVTASLDSKVRIYRKDLKTATFYLDETFDTGQADLRALTLSVDDQILATGGEDCEIRIWRLEPHSGEYPLSQTLEGHDGKVRTIAISDNKKVIASGGFDYKVIIWESQYGSETYDLFQIITEHTNKIRSLVFTKNGEKLFVASHDHYISIWSRGDKYENFKILQKIRVGDDVKNLFPCFLSLSPDEKTLILASQEEYIRVFKELPWKKQFSLEQKIHEPGRRFYSAVLSQDTNMIVGGAGGLGLIVYKREDDKSDFERFQPIGCHFGAISSIDLTRDEKTLVSGSEDKMVRVWRKVADNRFANSQCLKGHSKEVLRVKISGDGRLIISASRDKTIRVWSLESDSFPIKYQFWQMFDAEIEFANQISMSLDAKTLVIGGSDKTLQVMKWQVRRRTIKKQQSLELVDLNSVLKQNGEEKRDLGNLNLVETLTGHSSGIRALTIKRDGKMMVSGDSESKILVWRVQRGSGFSVYQELEGHAKAVIELKLNSKGDILASVGLDKTLRIWKLGGEEKNRHKFVLKHSLKQDNTQLTRLDMNKDGSVIVSGGENSNITVWLKNPETGKFLNHQIIQGHKDAVEQALLSKDCHTIYSCSDDCSIKIWTRKPDRLAKQLYIKKFTKEPDFSRIGSNSKGSLICSGGLHHLRFYEKPDSIPKNLNLRTVQIEGGHNKVSITLKISADGKKIMTGAIDDKIVLWNFDNENGAIEYDYFLEGHVERIWFADFNDKEGVIVSGGRDMLVRVWTRNPETRRYEFDYALTGHAKQVYSVILSPCAKILASGSEDKTIRIWRKGENPFGKFEHAQTLEGHKGKTYGIVFSSDNKFMVSCNQDKSIKIWVLADNSTDYKLFQTLLGHTHFVRTPSLTKDDMTLVTTSKQRELFVWTRDSEDKYQFSLTQKINDHTKGVFHPKINPSGTMIVTGSRDGKIMIHKKNIITNEFQKDQVIELLDQDIWGLDVSPDDNKIVLSTLKRNVIVYKRNSPEEQFFECFRTTWLRMQILSIAINSTGDMVMAADQNDTLSVWIKDKKLNRFVFHEKHTEEHKQPINTVIFNHNETGVLTGSSDKTIKIWEIDQKSKKLKVKQTLVEHTDSVQELALSANGKLLVSASNDQTVRLWLRKKKHKHRYYEIFQTLRGHKDRVFGCCLTGNGSTIASASADQTVIIWRRDHNSEEFTLNQVLRGHSEEMNKVVISDDGHTLFFSSDDCTVRMWKLDTHAFHITAQFKFETRVFDIKHFRDHLLAGHPGTGASLAITSGTRERAFSAFKDNYRTASILNRAFSEYELDISMKILLENLPRMQKAQDQKDGEELLRLHCEINPLLWFCILKSPKYLKKALKVWHYEEWIYENCKELDPFLYCFELGNQELITVWAEYFQEHPKRLVVNDLEKFNKLISCKNSELQSYGISKLNTDSGLSKGIEPIDVYSLKGNRGFEAVKSNQIILSSKIQQEFKQMGDKSKPGVKVKGKSACVGISPDLSRLLTFLKRVDNLTIDNKMKLRPVVMTIFEMYRHTFLIYAVINLIGKILLFMIVIFQRQEWYIYVPFYIIYSLMFVYEMIDLFSKGFGYFNSIYNYLDFGLYPAAMWVVTYVIFQDFEFLKDQFNNFLVFLVLYVALTRAVSMLRAFDSIRYLILMILRVYLDMTPFIIVLTFYIVGTGSLNILLSFTNKVLGPGEDGLPRYGLTLEQLRISSDVIYNWGYGNWEGNADMNALNFWFYIHTGVFIGLIMFNLLIAIISGTYEQFTQEKQRVDLKEVIDMLLEMAEFLNFWRKIREGIFGVRESEKIYLHFLIPTEEANDLEDLTGQVEELREFVFEKVGGIDMRVKGIEDKVEGIEIEVKSVNSKIDMICEFISKQQGQKNQQET